MTIFSPQGQLIDFKPWIWGNLAYGSSSDCSHRSLRGTELNPSVSMVDWPASSAYTEVSSHEEEHSDGLVGELSDLGCWAMFVCIWEGYGGVAKEGVELALAFFPPATLSFQATAFDLILRSGHAYYGPCALISPHSSFAADLQVSNRRIWSAIRITSPQFNNQRGR